MLFSTRMNIYVLRCGGEEGKANITIHENIHKPIAHLNPPIYLFIMLKVACSV